MNSGIEEELFFEIQATHNIMLFKFKCHGVRTKLFLLRHHCLHVFILSARTSCHETRTDVSAENMRLNTYFSLDIFPEVLLFAISEHPCGLKLGLGR